MILGHAYHDDIQGILQTAVTGVTQYTMRAYRSTKIVMPHIAQGDIFSMVFQMSHRKKLGVNLDSVHLHIIPVASANGDIKINWAWGWYNAVGATIPSTLPNTGSTTFSLTTADQYVDRIETIISNLTPPTSESYSSILLVEMERVAPAGTNWGALNEFALMYEDGHQPVNRYGSYLEGSDS